MTCKTLSLTILRVFQIAVRGGGVKYPSVGEIGNFTGGGGFTRL